MTSKKTTRRALLSSVLALLLCVSMLVGSTFAWFTDEVSSTGNIIKSGTLDVELLYGDSADAITNDASKGAIFNYQYWEPGYTQIKYVKIANVGNLAFKYQMNVIPNELSVEGDVNLADVIDVYMIPVTENMETITRENYATLGTKAGTLTEMMAKAGGAGSGILLPAEGVGSENYNQIDAPRGEISYCIVLHMQEEAGNEYQNLSVGEGFKVELLATQYTWEKDSFDHLYDDDADFVPKADVQLTGGKWIETSTHGTIWANSTFQFQPTQSYEEAQQSSYRYWHADFVVSADKDIPANAVILPGYYVAYCDDYNDGKWIGLSSDEVITAGTEIRLVDTLGQLLGGTVTVNYEEICKWGNDGTGFLCGVSDQSKGALAGTTLTVELRLYETKDASDTTTNTKNEETGEYITIGTYTYTFGALEVSTADELAEAVANGATNVYLMDGEYDVYGCGGKTLTISGSENAVIKLYNEGEDGCDYAFGGNGTGVGNITFNGVTIDTTSNTGNYKGFAYMKGTFNDCNFVGAYSLNNANDFEFNNCTFDFKNGYFWTWGAKSVTFNGCTFNGNSKAILAHGWSSTVININDCTFAATEKGYTGAGDNTATVEIDPAGSNTYTITFTGDNTKTDSYSGWTRIKDGSTGHTITTP